MVKYILQAKAELENVSEVEPLDTVENPFEYTFKIACGSCHQQHNKLVEINRFEQYEIPGSRGDASFVFKCQDCKKSHSASIERTKEKIVIGEKNNWVTLLNIDARGIEFLDFSPIGQWTCIGQKGSRFNDVDLEDLEWYDFDEDMSQEVSITDVKFQIK